MNGRRAAAALRRGVMSNRRVDQKTPSESSSAVTRVTGKPPSLFLSLSLGSLSLNTPRDTQRRKKKRRDRNIENTCREKSSGSATRNKAEEPERVQVDSKRQKKK
ncbi:hypothetical protein M9H77_28423 [Catharanthus roseus]|uniref:Uncharacterized protein n=1 Tax=Catharanthus roseus TaxID=4058 RepID=A0ACC0AH81_CATRO|nr:hypothetical protein M9H77_28423 [Catharanthus roseus]